MSLLLCERREARAAESQEPIAETRSREAASYQGVHLRRRRVLGGHIHCGEAIEVRIDVAGGEIERRLQVVLREIE